MDYQNVGCPSLVVELKYCPQTRHNRVKMKDGPGLMIMKTFMTQLWYDARLYDPYSSWILVCWIETMNIIVGESLHGAPITVVSWPFEMRGFGVRVITNPRETPGEHSDDWSDCSPILSLKTAHWVFRASAHPSHHRAPCWHIHWYFHGILSDALRSFFWLICNLLTWNHKFSERKKIRRLKRKIVERDTEIMSIMVDLTRFFSFVF